MVDTSAGLFARQLGLLWPDAGFRFAVGFRAGMLAGLGDTEMIRRIKLIAGILVAGLLVAIWVVDVLRFGRVSPDKADQIRFLMTRDDVESVIGHPPAYTEPDVMRDGHSWAVWYCNTGHITVLYLKSTNGVYLAVNAEYDSDSPRSPPGFLTRVWRRLGF